MPINLYTVENHFREQGWTLLSDTYKNLDTLLTVECPKGHQIEITYGKWRKKMTCPKCFAGDAFTKHEVPQKSQAKRVLALDAATENTGYALYDDAKLLTYGVFHVSGTLPTDERINTVKRWVQEAIKTWSPDIVGVENIQLQNYGGKYGTPAAQVRTFQTLANLQGVLIDALYELGVQYDLVYPSAWRSWCGINSGDQNREAKKAQSKAAVKMWYGIDCTDDEADAICIGKYFVNEIKLANAETIGLWVKP